MPNRHAALALTRGGLGQSSANAAIGPNFIAGKRLSWTSRFPDIAIMKNNMPTVASPTLLAKLHPRRFPGMSGLMAAIVGCILRERFTDPAIASLVVTSDGCLLAVRVGDIGANEFIGSAADLDNNWRRLLDCAGLTPEEREEADCLFAAAPIQRF